MQELEAERLKMMEAMATQSAALQQAVDKLASELAASRTKTGGGPLDGVKINRLSDVKLPADVKQWRSAHVQAWVGFQMELPQYMAAFQEASVDGLVLMKHVNRDTLVTALNIGDELHCGKILEGIRALQAKQEAIDQAHEKERLRKLRKKKEEEERHRAYMEQLELDANKKKQKKQKQKDGEGGGTKKKKKKKKSSTGAPAPKTYFGEVREQNELERAKIARDMRLYRSEQLKKKDKADSLSKTWKFEYTGAAPPRADKTIWDSNPFEKKVGSAAYQRAMQLDVLTAPQFSAPPPGGMGDTGGGEGEGDGTTGPAGVPRPPSSVKVRPVPTTLSPEELVALVKGAMFDVSSWLVGVEQMNWRAKHLRDADLEDVNDEKLLALLHGRHAAAPATDTTLGDLDAPASIASDFAPPGYDDLVGIAATGEEEEEGEEPPPYDAIETVTMPAASPSRPSRVDESESVLSLPAYDEVLTSKEFLATPRNVSGGSLLAPGPPNEKIATLLQASAAELAANEAQQPPDFDRMTLVFNALVDQKNNNARWLGTNDKLTRMKFYGGCESLLRLKIPWPQFNALWTQLDYQRSGDLDVKEFKAFFGDLNEFEDLAMGTASLTTRSKSKSITALTKCLFSLCDVLRHAGFTVVEMFSGFDRNGSGDISISEFTSMLRLVIGNDVEKRLIYQALSVLDVNGDKKISLDEVLRFIYRIWKSQLDELAERLAVLDDRITGDSEAIELALRERRDIKEAIKKNFPREWRDRLEREGGHAIPGPFQNLLQRMGVNSSSGGGGAGGGGSRPLSATLGSTGAFGSRPGSAYSAGGGGGGGGSGFNTTGGSSMSADFAGGGGGRVGAFTPNHQPSSSGGGGGGGALNLSSPGRTYRPSEMGSPGATATAGAGQSLTPQRPPGVSRTLTGGQNQLMRFRIKMPGGQVPTRAGATLGVPQVHDFNRENANLQSSEVAAKILKEHAPL